MPQRTLNLLLAALGLLAVAGVILLGRDVYRHARTGPRWKRRLLGAGLMALGFLGIVPPERSSAGEAPVAVKAGPEVAKPKAGLQAFAEWKTVQGAWTEVMPLATSGKSTTAQRKEADKKLKAATDAIQSLEKAGLLLPSEAKLLLIEAKNIRADIYRDPPTDSQVECYDMMFVPAAQKSFERLNVRMPFLEKLLAADKLHPQACRKVIAAVEADLQILSRQSNLKQLPADERATVEQTRDKVKDHVRKLNARVQNAPSGGSGGVTAGPLSPLAASPEWKVVATAWHEAMPLALSGRSTTKQRSAARAKLKAAEAAKVVPSIEADVKTLSDDQTVAKMGEKISKEVVQTRDAVKAQLAKLKGLLAEVK